MTSFTHAILDQIGHDMEGSNLSEAQEAQKAVVIDDDKDILELLKYRLEDEGYQVKTLDSGVGAAEICKKWRPDMVLLDIMMPIQDGVETCRQIREVLPGDETLIVFLTARGEEYSEIAAFDAGADDYVTKPIRPRALMRRLRNLMKRGTDLLTENQISVGDLIIDKNIYTVYQDSREVQLPKKEFELLYFLAENANRIYSRDQLLDEIWGNDVQVLSRTVDVHVLKLRQKLGRDYIQTIKGVGYRFVV